jgi:hypothetical protein
MCKTLVKEFREFEEQDICGFVLGVYAWLEM